MPPRHQSLLAAPLLTLALLLSACGGTEEPASPAPTSAATKDASSDATEATTAPYTPTEIASATVTGPVDVYPDATSPTPTSTISNPTEYGLTRVFRVLGHEGNRLEVMLPTRPNFSTGFIDASDVSITTTDYHLKVELGAFQLTLYKGADTVFTVPVGTAQATYPTPPGEYFITDLVQPPDPNSVYGTYAYGLSGYSEQLTSFNGGDGQLGIHGTNKPDSIGKQESHGCIRLYNQDIERLVPLLELGTPVQVVA